MENLGFRVQPTRKCEVASLHCVVYRTSRRPLRRSGEAWSKFSNTTTPWRTAGAAATGTSTPGTGTWSTTSRGSSGAAAATTTHLTIISELAQKQVLFFLPD